MKIIFEMETMIENAPGHMLHNMTIAQIQVYHNLWTRKSALIEELKILMVHDHGSSQVSSKFGVYNFVVFSEILARNCALVFLEHHQPTQHG